MAFAAREHEEGRELEARPDAGLAEVPSSAALAPIGQDGPGEVDLLQAIAMLRARVDEEFRIAERIDSKGRQLFALAAGVFAVVQTVAFGSFGQTGVTSAERAVIAAVALIAGVVLARTAHVLADSEDLLLEADTRPEAVIEWVNAAESKDEVTLRVLSELGRVARARDTNNRARGRRYDIVQTSARWALIFTGVELMCGVIARI